MIFMLKREFEIFCMALSFYSRIPVPAFAQYNQDCIDESTKYLPVVGWIVGAMSAFSYFVFSLIFNNNVALLLSMITSVILTGAMHEDGFGDFCDGMGGGFDKEQILKIMKDSRIGTYANVGLLGILSLKFFALQSINSALIPIILICGHSISRYVAGSIAFTHKYVRKDDDSSKSLKFLKNTKWNVILVSSILAFLPLLLLGIKAFILLLPMLIVRQIFAFYLNKRLGGYTGDCLGALQQISETVFYLFAGISIWNCI